jgi:hypothetical protein
VRKRTPLLLRGGDIGHPRLLFSKLKIFSFMGKNGETFWSPKSSRHFSLSLFLSLSLSLSLSCLYLLHGRRRCPSTTPTLSPRARFWTTNALWDAKEEEEEEEEERIHSRLFAFSFHHHHHHRL